MDNKNLLIVCIFVLFSIGNVKSECGKVEEDGLGYRVASKNSDNAEYGEFPWLVRILTNKSTNYLGYTMIFKCIGSLINSRVVLTAAHCVKKRKERPFQLVAGDYDTGSENEKFSPQVKIFLN